MFTPTAHGGTLSCTPSLSTSGLQRKPFSSTAAHVEVAAMESACGRPDDPGRRRRRAKLLLQWSRPGGRMPGQDRPRPHGGRPAAMEPADNRPEEDDATEGRIIDAHAA